METQFTVEEIAQVEFPSGDPVNYDAERDSVKLGDEGRELPLGWMREFNEDGRLLAEAAERRALENDAARHEVPEFEPGTQVSRIGFDDLYEVIGNAPQGGDRGWCVRVRDEYGAEHRYRAWKLEVV